METSRGDAAATTWIFRGDGPARPRVPAQAAPGGSHRPGRKKGVKGSAQKRKNCLAFGLPEDGATWAERGHRIVFLDDREAKVQTARDAGLEAYLVSYNTSPRTDWDADPYGDPARLRIASPSYDFRGATFWDVVIVAGPDSNRRKSPGRAAPIAHAAALLRRQRLAHPDRRVDVVVADARRPHERELCLAYFRRADIPQAGRGDAAAATWIFRRGRCTPQVPRASGALHEL